MPTQTFYGVLGAKSVLAGFMSIPLTVKKQIMRLKVLEIALILELAFMTAEQVGG